MKLSVGVAVSALATHLVVLVESAWVSLCRKSDASNLPGTSRSCANHENLSIRTQTSVLVAEVSWSVLKKSLAHVTLLTLSLRLCWTYVQIYCDQ